MTKGHCVGRALRFYLIIVVVLAIGYIEASYVAPLIADEVEQAFEPLSRALERLH